MIQFIPLFIIFKFPVWVQLGYIVICLWFAILGRNRIGGFWCFLFASVLLSPVVGFMMLLVAGKKKPPQALKD